MPTFLPTPMGPGFFIFFQEIIETGAGGYYKPLRKTYYLKPLDYYKKEIKEKLKKEKEVLIEAKQDLIVSLKEIEERPEEKALKKQIIIIEVKLADIKRELRIIEAKLQIIPKLASILRDDDEVLLILNS